MRMTTAWRGRSRYPRAQARARIRYEAWAGAAVFVALFALAGTVSPEQPGHYPACPFRALTGFACPGCGSLRALHDLAHGHVMTGLTHNAMLMMTLPFAMAAWVRVITGRTGAVASRRRLGYAALTLLVMWTVVRNLPIARTILTAA